MNSAKYFQIFVLIILHSATSCSLSSDSKLSDLSVQGQSSIQQAPWRTLPEYLLLSQADTFECSAIGEGGDTPISTVAFTRLVLRDDAHLVFNDLVEEKNLVAKLYGLKGLWLTDRRGHNQAFKSLSNLTLKIPSLCACDGGPAPLNSFTRSEHYYDSPMSLLSNGIDWIERQERNTDKIEKLKSVLLNKNAKFLDRLEAAEVLAYSRGAQGLKILLSNIDEDLSGDIFFMFRVTMPPWIDNVVPALKDALEGDQNLPLRGALLVIGSLSINPVFRKEIKPYLPVLKRRFNDLITKVKINEDYNEEDFEILEGILYAFSKYGESTSPYLIKAIERSLFNSELRIPWAHLNQWEHEILNSLEMLLGHKHSSVKETAIQCLCNGLSNLSNPSSTRRDIEKLIPNMRLAAKSLDENESTYSSGDLLELIEESLLIHQFSEQEH